MNDKDDFFKPNHYWMEIESDNNGVPTKYKCRDCLECLEIPSRDKQVREYLIKKYGKAKT